VYHSGVVARRQDSGDMRVACVPGIAKNPQQSRIVKRRQQQEGVDDFGSLVRSKASKRVLQRRQQVMSREGRIVATEFFSNGGLGKLALKLVGHREHGPDHDGCVTVVPILCRFDQRGKKIEIGTPHNQVTSIGAHYPIALEDRCFERRRRVMGHGTMGFAKGLSLGLPKTGISLDKLSVALAIMPADCRADGRGAQVGRRRLQTSRQKRKASTIA
jgi:hypothetical protein